MTDAQRDLIAEPQPTRDRPAVQRTWYDSAAPNRQTIYASMPATRRGMARVQAAR